MISTVFKIGVKIALFLPILCIVFMINSKYSTIIYDERLLQKNIIEKLSIQKQHVIVLGSSRSYPISLSDKLQKSQSFFNHSCPAAILEDFIGLYGVYQKSQIKPNTTLTIILECSPWILNKNHQMGYRLHELKNDYEDLLKEILAPNEINQDIIEFNVKNLTFFDKFNPELFQKILKSLLRSDKKGMLTNKAQDYKMRSKKYVLSDALSYANRTPIQGLGNYKELNTAKFEAFINFLIKHHIRIIFFIPPYHSVVYKKLLTSPEYKMVFRAEEYFRNFALKNNIEVAGSYNPTHCGLDDTDFYDGNHTCQAATGKIFKNINFNL